MGNILQQQIELGGVQAFILVWLEQPVLYRQAKQADARQLDVLHIDAVAVGRLGINAGARQGTGQTLQLVEPLLLFLQQALLTVTGKIAITGQLSCL